MNKQEVLQFISEHNLFSLERKFDVEKALSSKVSYDIRESDVFIEIINKKTRSCFSFINLSFDVEATALFKVRSRSSKSEET
jgi:hypothetical protein